MTTTSANSTVALAVHVEQLFIMTIAGDSPATEAAVSSDGFRDSVVLAVAQVHNMNAANISVLSSSTVSDVRRLSGEFSALIELRSDSVNEMRRLEGSSRATIGIGYSIPVANEEEQIAKIKATQDNAYHTAFQDYLSHSEDARVAGLKITSLYHRTITAGTQDGSWKLTMLGAMFTVYGTMNDQWGDAEMTTWGNNAAVAAQAALIASLSSIVDSSRQQTWANVTTTSAGPPSLSASFFMYATVPRDDNMTNAAYDVRIESYRVIFNTVKDQQAAGNWQQFEEELQIRNIPALPDMGREPPASPPASGSTTKGASTSLVLVIFLVAAVVLFLGSLCITAIWKDPRKRAKYCWCFSGKSEMVQGFTDDLEAAKGLHEADRPVADFTTSNMKGPQAVDVVGVPARGKAFSGQWIFSCKDDGKRKLVLTDSHGQRVKEGYVPSTSTDWDDPLTWTMVHEKDTSFSIENFHYATQVNRPTGDFTQSNIPGTQADAVVGVAARGEAFSGQWIFSWMDDGKRKLVLTDSHGRKVKEGYVPASSKDWEDPSTWTMVTETSITYSIENFHYNSQGHDELAKSHGLRGAAHGDEDEEEQGGKVNFLDLLHFNNLSHVDAKNLKTPKKAPRNESPAKQRLVTQKLGNTADQETEDLRFAMGAVKPWKSPNDKSPGYRGSPASTRATTNSSRDTNSPHSSAHSGREDTPDKRTSPHSLQRSPSLKSEGQVTIETVCSESETSSSEDDDDDKH
jgi:hypothetical protein